MRSPGELPPWKHTSHFKVNLPCTQGRAGWVGAVPGLQSPERGEHKAPSAWQKKMSLHDESSLSQYLFCLTTELSQLTLTFHGKMPDVKKLSWLCLWLFHLLGHKVLEVIKNPWGCLKRANNRHKHNREGSFASVRHLNLLIFNWKRTYSSSKVKKHTVTMVSSAKWNLDFMIQLLLGSKRQGLHLKQTWSSLWGEVHLEGDSWYCFGKVLLIIRKSCFF